MKEPNVDKLLRNITGLQWLRWKIYMQQLVPNEPERMDIRFASIVQAIWNVQIAKSTKKNAKPKFEPLSEFRIYFGDLEKPLPQGPTRAQSAAEQWARLKATFMGMVGKTPPADPPVTE